MQDPDVSVVIPTYNRPDMLLQAVESALNQTYRSLEVVVVDDASHVRPVEESEILCDPRVNYIRHPENRGVAAAINTGIKNSRGRYIAFLGDDDRYLPLKTERQMEIVRNSPSSVGVVACGCYFTNEKEGTRFIYEPRGKHVGRFYHRDFTAATCLIKKECFERVGLLDESLRCLVDFDLILRISEFYEFRFCREPLYEVRIHERGRVTDNHAKLVVTLDKIYHGLSARIDVLPIAEKRKAYSMYRQERGNFLFEAGDTRSSRREFWESIMLDPLNLKSWTMFFSSVGGSHSFKMLERISSGLGRKGVLP